ncbi:MAG: hypothetical protein EA357_11455 [Micavibrio sp.]|nr:MAG: hypothetical protein EA357_11455 [Micavibrio sp.]
MNASDELARAQDILKRLDEHLRRAIWYAELLKRSTFEKDVNDAFGESYESWGAIYIRQALQEALIAALMRILHGDWKGKDTASLDVLNNILKKDGFISHLKETGQQNVASHVSVDNIAFPNDGNLSEDDKKNIADSIERSKVEGFLERFDETHQALSEDLSKIKGDAERAAVKDYRDSQVAHIALLRNTKSKKNPKLKYNQILNLLEKTVAVIEKANLLITQTHMNYADSKKHAEKCADLFWRRVAHLQ